MPRRTALVPSVVLGICVCLGAPTTFAQEAAGKQAAAAPQNSEAPAQATAQAPAQASAAGSTANATFPDLSIPKDADRATLEKILATAKRARPASPEQYQQVQTAIRDASNGLVKLIPDKNDPVRMQAELDALSSAAALMVNESSESRAQVLERMQAHLKSRDELNMADVQTGIIVAFYLEMQPQKTPARDAYAMLDQRLKDDPREEMQAVRTTLQANVRRLEMLGNKLELDAKTIDGQAIKTDDFAGKFVIVDFFATWCKPCVAELPQLEKYYGKYHDHGLEVVTISIDADRGTLDSFLETHQLPWPVIYDDAQTLEDKLQMKYGVLSLPTVLLLNKEGVVVSLEARGPELDRLMERIFEAPTPADAPDTPAANGAGRGSKPAQDAKQ